MLFGYILLAIALTISSVAAYYSIAGLTAIFAAAFWPIVVMGSVLELGKVATTVWLHKYWARAPYQFKLYLVPAIGILMLITSMGIFGFLSKAHLDQAVPSGDIASQVQIFDDKIATEKSNIEAARKALKQMDAQVDERLSRSTDDKGAERAVQIRKSQAKERTSLQNEISASQKKITQLQTERAPIASQQRKVEAEVGPIKYIAALIYGDNPDANLLEKAVRWVIILIVFVFDPLALVLILAADQTFAWAREDKRKGWKQQWIPTTEDPWHDEPAPKEKDWSTFFTKQEPVEIKEEKEEAPAQDDPPKKPEPDPEPVVEPAPTPIEEPKPEPVPEPAPPPPPPPVIHHDPEPIGRRPPPAMDEAPINPIPKSVVIHESPNQIVIPDFSIGAESAAPVNAGFGTEFPRNPVKGDMFLRVDYLPSKLYKWNGQKWIEVDKTKTDSFAYDDRYIQHLIEKIDSGEYDVDLLSPAEQEQISRYLNDGQSTS
jgi:hypothetical protein